MIRQGRASPLKELEDTPTPEAIVDIATRCCMRDPAARITFTAIATRICEMLPQNARNSFASRYRSYVRVFY